MTSDKNEQTKSTDVPTTKKKSKSTEDQDKSEQNAAEQSKSDATEKMKKNSAAEQRSEHSPPEESTTSDKPLNKRQRQQLKRKARLEAEAAEKQKKVKLDAKDHTENTSTKQDKKIWDHKSQEAETSAPTQAELLSLQSAWSTPLHPTLLSALHTMNYTYPTPIQSATLSAAILGRRDICGAAPTGSGKTLSYGLPILQWLLENDDGGNDDNEDTEGCGRKQNEVKERLPLQALILVPTREVSPMTFDKSYAIASSNNHPNLYDLLACYSSDQRTLPCLFK